VVGGAVPPTVSVSAYGGATVSGPEGITRGPDGAVWFTNSTGHSIGRIATTGVVTDYTAPSISAPTAITVGPDGALWFVDGAGSIGRITTAGAVTSFPAPSIGSPVAIAAGPDGDLWFASGGKWIGRMTPGGTVTQISDPADMRGTYGITAGPDGAMWFTNYLGSSIGRIEADGAVTIYRDPLIQFPEAIVTGPDGALWFTDDSGTIGRITTTGSVTSYGTVDTVGHPQGLTVGPDGALWATDRGGSIVRITVAGAITRFTDPTIEFPVGIAAGSDGALWFTNYTANTIGRLVVDAPSVEPALAVAATAAVVQTRAGELVRVPVRIGRAAKVTVFVQEAASGSRVRLQAGSRIADVVATKPTSTLVASIPRAGTYVVSLALPHRPVRASYRLVIAAAGPGKPTRTTLSFRG
jgi:streptogramin lyase